jgi:hypothetical protein
MILTQEQLNILNHVVVDGQAWADRATEKNMLAKVAKYKKSYDDAVVAGNYKNRIQRDTDEEIAEAAKEAADFEALPYGRKREMEYPPYPDYLDGIVNNDQAQVDKYISDCKAVKDKYPKE